MNASRNSRKIVEWVINMKEINEMIHEYNQIHTGSGLYDDYVNLLCSEGLGSEKVFNHITEKIKTDAGNPNHYFHLFEHYLWKKDFVKAFEVIDLFKIRFPETDTEGWKEITNYNKPEILKKEMKRWHIDICGILSTL